MSGFKSLSRGAFQAACLLRSSQQQLLDITTLWKQRRPSEEARLLPSPHLPWILSDGRVICPCVCPPLILPPWCFTSPHEEANLLPAGRARSAPDEELRSQEEKTHFNLQALVAESTWIRQRLAFPITFGTVGTQAVCFPALLQGVQVFAPGLRERADVVRFSIDCPFVAFLSHYQTIVD